jgi:hypothetical protein
MGKLVATLSTKHSIRNDNLETNYGVLCEILYCIPYTGLPGMGLLLLRRLSLSNLIAMTF